MNDETMAEFDARNLPNEFPVVSGPLQSIYVVYLQAMECDIPIRFFYLSEDEAKEVSLKHPASKIVEYSLKPF